MRPRESGICYCDSKSSVTACLGLELPQKHISGCLWCQKGLTEEGRHRLKLDGTKQWESKLMDASTPLSVSWGRMQHDQLHQAFLSLLPWQDGWGIKILLEYSLTTGNVIDVATYIIFQITCLKILNLTFWLYSTATGKPLDLCTTSHISVNLFMRMYPHTDENDLWVPLLSSGGKSEYIRNKNKQDKETF